MIKATRSGVCPRCHTFIRTGSLIVRLEKAERPWSDDDGRSCWRTGEYWQWNGQPISMHPRFWVHWRCYVEQMLGERTCVYCNGEDDMTVDHVIPRRFGGSDFPSNLVPACRPCNSRKSTLPAELVGSTPKERADWLRDRGWVKEGTSWTHHEGGPSYSLAVAVRSEAFGWRVIG
jgi:5-methylcytosine-specific restriction endonuclease McrA